MTTELPERLRDLAAEAPGPLSAGALWRSGRRRHRRQLTSVAALAVFLAAGTAVVGVSVWHSTRPAPAPPATHSGALQIPDRLFNPSPWTASTRTPGRLVAVMGGVTHDHFPFGSDKNGIVGVAAGSQTYRFLDLPGQDPASRDVQLAPDGLHLAYWLRGPPGQQGTSGFAVLDLITGRVQRFVVDSDAPFGVYVQSFTWVDSDSLALVGLRFSSLEPNSETGRTRTYLYETENPSGSVVLGGRTTGLPRANVLDIPVTTQPQQVCAPTCPGQYAEMVGHRRLRVFRPGGARFDVRLSAPARSVVYDAVGDVLATTAGNVDASGPTSGTLMVGRIVNRHVSLTSVPGGGSYAQVVAWVDGTHVATVRQTRNGLVYDVVDIRTGDRRELTSKPWYGFSLAFDAVHGATTVPGIAPHAPWNPRWIALGALGALLLVTGAVATIVRRRTRARG